MYKRSTVACAVALAISASLSTSAFADGDADAERIKALEEQIKIFQQQLESLSKSVEAKTEETDEQIEAIVQAVDEREAAADKVSIHGYGELHYNNLSADDSANDKKEIDFHRFVLEFGYDFTDRIRFFSEFELEHALVGDSADGDNPGEVELEQAYIQFDVSETSSVSGGIFLIPVGILNETHEPNTFYGVERNNVENVIVPATWWAGGALWTQQFGAGLQWDLAFHEGLAIPTSGSSAFRVRSGRQKTAEAVAEDFAATTRLKYTGVPGLELAGTINHQFDPSQASADGLDDGTLFEGHAVWNVGDFSLRALYAQWEFDGNDVEAADDDSQKGWYIEPSYKLAPEWGVFARYEDVEGARDIDEFNEIIAGVNYWPHEQVVLKFDVRQRDHDLASESGEDFDGFDLGLGYSF